MNIEKIKGNIDKRWVNISFKIIIFVLIMGISVLYSYRFRSITDDEFYNYGFAKNILDGLIPYRDFNMIIPPMFSYILSLFMLILGKRLIVYHMVMAFMIGIITLLIYRDIGIRVIAIYFLLLIYPFIGYNLFCLFLLIIILTRMDEGNNELLEALLISMMFLSKHTLGLLIIPSILYAKRRKKVIAVYGVGILLFLLYLVINNNLWQFIDYCFLGMFEFADKNNNGFSFLLILELVVITLLIYGIFKTKKREYVYVLVYQIIAFPIVDYVHFINAFIPVVYLYMKNVKNISNIFLALGILSFCITLNIKIFINDSKNIIYYENDNFMRGRACSSILDNTIDKIDEYLNNYKDRTPYFLGLISYLVKLNLDISINKYDIINNGNMGYNGSFRYINEIDKYCRNNKCLFVVSTYENNRDGAQTNQDIIKYIDSSYYIIYSSNIFNIYINNVNV